MWGLIKNEFQKLYYRRKLLIVVLVLSLLSAFLSFGHYKENKSNAQFMKPEVQIENMEERKKYLEASMKNASDEKKANLKQNIDDLNKQIEQIKLQPNLNDANWKYNLEKYVSQLEIKKSDTNLDDAAKESINKELLINKNLLENNIKPEENTHTTGFSTLRFIFQILGIIFIFMVIAVLTSDIVSAEYTPPTMKVLLTKPVSRARVLFSKYISAVVSSILIITLIELIVFSVMGIIFGFGDFSYPIIMGTKYKMGISQATSWTKALLPVVGSSYIVPMWKFLLYMLSLQTLSIVATVSFCFLLSTIVKSSMISMTISVVSSIAFIILMQIPYVNKISPFIFSSYGDTISCLQGNLSLRLNNSLATPFMSIIIMLSWSVFCYIISHTIFTKRDILI